MDAAEDKGSESESGSGSVAAPALHLSLFSNLCQQLAQRAAHNKSHLRLQVALACVDSDFKFRMQNFPFSGY